MLQGRKLLHERLHRIGQVTSGLDKVGPAVVFPKVLHFVPGNRVKGWLTRATHPLNKALGKRLLKPGLKGHVHIGAPDVTHSNRNTQLVNRCGPYLMGRFDNSHLKVIHLARCAHEGMGFQNDGSRAGEQLIVFPNEDLLLIFRFQDRRDNSPIGGRNVDRLSEVNILDHRAKVRSELLCCEPPAISQLLDKRAGDH